MLHGSWPAAHHEGGTATGPTKNGSAALEPGCGFDGEVVELALLLTSGAVKALESAAHARGITVAQLLRFLIRECLAHPGDREHPA